MATIVLPIEIKVRELDGYLYLAANLVKKGHTVVIGDRNDMDIFREIQPDVYVANSAVGSKLELFQELQSCGCKTVVIGSEGGVFSSLDRYFKKRISKELLEYTDMKFVWGERQADIISERTSFSDENLFVTGHPRFDLLHENHRAIYSQSVNDIQSRLGNYILVNTNFASINHHDKSHYKSTLENYGVEQPKDKEEYLSMLLELFKTAITELSTFDKVDNIVLRPHPVEDHEYYKSEFAQNSTVIVEHSGDVIPWILGSKVVLHNACTTGIESAMLNTPVIALDPETEYEDTGRSHLPNVVSKSVATVDELLEQVQRYLETSSSYKFTTKQRSELQQYFANVEEPAVPKIAESIDRYLQGSTESSYPSLSYTRRIKNWVKRRPIAPTVQRLRGINTGNSEYRTQKFPGLDAEEVRLRLEDFEGIIDASELTVRRVNYLDDIYRIEQI